VGRPEGAAAGRMVRVRPHPLPRVRCLRDNHRGQRRGRRGPVARAHPPEGVRAPAGPGRQTAAGSFFGQESPPPSRGGREGIYPSPLRLPSPWVGRCRICRRAPSPYGKGGGRGLSLSAWGSIPTGIDLPALSRGVGIPSEADPSPLLALTQSVLLTLTSWEGIGMGFHVTGSEEGGTPARHPAETLGTLGRLCLCPGIGPPAPGGDAASQAGRRVYRAIPADTLSPPVSLSTSFPAAAFPSPRRIPAMWPTVP